MNVSIKGFQKGHLIFFPKEWYHQKLSYSHKSLHWYQCFNVRKMVDYECLIHCNAYVL